jgi:hypothetical protein
MHETNNDVLDAIQVSLDSEGVIKKAAEFENSDKTLIIQIKSNIQLNKKKKISQLVMKNKQHNRKKTLQDPLRMLH